MFPFISHSNFSANSFQLIIETYFQFVVKTLNNEVLWKKIRKENGCDLQRLCFWVKKSSDCVNKWFLPHISHQCHICSGFGKSIWIIGIVRKYSAGVVHLNLAGGHNFEIYSVWFHRLAIMLEHFCVCVYDHSQMYPGIFAVNTKHTNVWFSKSL